MILVAKDLPFAVSLDLPHLSGFLLYLVPPVILRSSTHLFKVKVCSLALNLCLCFLDSAVSFSLFSFLCLPLQRLLHISYQSFPAFLSYYHPPHLFQSSYNGSHSFNNTSNSKSFDTNLIELMTNRWILYTI